MREEIDLVELELERYKTELIELENVIIDPDELTDVEMLMVSNVYALINERNGQKVITDK